MSKNNKRQFKVFMDDHYGPDMPAKRGENWRFFATEQKPEGRVPLRAQFFIPVDQEINVDIIRDEAEAALRTNRIRKGEILLSRAVQKLFTVTTEGDSNGK